MVIENALRLDTKEAIASLKALDTQAGITDAKLAGVGNRLDQTGHAGHKQQVGNLNDEFKQLGDSSAYAQKNLDDTKAAADNLGRSIESTGAKSSRTARSIAQDTESVSASFSRMSTKMQSDMHSLQGIIDDLHRQRSGATSAVDKALLDQKLAVAKASLRDLARDSAWDQLKGQAKSVGMEFDNAAKKITGGGGGGGNFTSLGGAMGGGGFLGGVKQVISNVPLMGAAMVGALPAVTALGGALVALTGSLAAAGAGAGALGVGTAGVLGVGGASVLAAVKPAESNIQAGMKAYEQYTQAVQQHGAQSKQAETAQAKVSQDAAKLGTTPAFFTQMSTFGEDWKKQIEPATKAITGVIGTAMGDFRKAMPEFGNMVNQNVTAVANALKPAIDTLTGPAVQAALQSLSATFQQIAGPMVNTGVNLLQSFLNVAVAAEPYVVQAFGAMDNWSKRLVQTTSDASKMQGIVGTLVGQFKDWGHMIGAAGKLLFDIFSAGAPSGDSMVNSLTKTFDKWDAWIKTHPQQVHDFFQTAIHDTENIAKLLGNLVGVLAQWAQGLQPLFSLVTSLAGMLGSGPLGALLLGGGAAYLLRGGAGGKLMSPLTYLMNPAAGVAQTAAVATGRAVGGGASATAEMAAVAQGTAASQTLTKRLTGGIQEAQKQAETFSTREGMVALGMGEKSALAMEKMSGLGTKIADAAGAAGKFMLPLAALQGVMGAATTPGGPMDKFVGALHAITFGLIPLDKPNALGGVSAQQVGARGAQFAAGASSPDLIRRYQVLGAVQSQYAANPNISDQQAQAALTRQGFSAAEVRTTENALGQGGFAGNTMAFLKKLQPRLNTAVRSMVDQLGTQFKFYSEPAMFSQLKNWIGGLPKTSQIAGIKSMEALSASLERQGKLPRGATKQLIAEINREMPQLAADMRHAGLQSTKALRDTLVDDKSKKKIQTDIREAVSPFEDLRALRGIKISSGNVKDVWVQAMAGLKTLMNSKDGPPGQREAAKKAYDELAADVGAVTKVSQDNWNNYNQNTSKFMQGLTGIFGTEAGKQQLTVQSTTNVIGSGLNNVVNSVNSVLKQFGMGTLQQVSTPKGQAGAPSGIHGAPQNIGPQTTVGAPIKATGGRLAGVAHGDHIPLFGKGGQLLAVADAGELVVNRHTEARVDQKLARFGTTLAREVDNTTLPHFQAGGRTPGGSIVTASTFSDPTTASGRNHIPGFAELSNPPGSLGFNAMGHLPMGTMVAVTYPPGGGKTINIPKIDVGAGGPGLGGHIRAIDLTSEAAAQFPGFPGLADVAINIGGLGGAAGAGFVPVVAPKITGPKGTWTDMANKAMVDVTKKANSFLQSKAPTGGGGVPGAPGGPMGVGSYMGIPMANWVIESLNFAASRGVRPQPTSGYRPGFDPHTVGGVSEHAGTQYPHGAVDFGGYNDPVAFANKMAVVNATAGFKWPLLAPMGFHDDGHASGTGHATGGRIAAPGFAGWYRDGGSFLAHSPTTVGVGDGRTERVDVTPVGRSNGASRAGVNIEQIVVHNGRDGDIRDQIIRELEAVYAHLESTHLVTPGELT